MNLLISLPETTVEQVFIGFTSFRFPYSITALLFHYK
jgi:hypothetical protein